MMLFYIAVRKGRPQGPRDLRSRSCRLRNCSNARSGEVIKFLVSFSFKIYLILFCFFLTEIKTSSFIETLAFKLVVSIQTTGFNIHNIQFAPGSLGSRELCIKWRDMTDYVRVEIVAGPPAKLILPGWDIAKVGCRHFITFFLQVF